MRALPLPGAAAAPWRRPIVHFLALGVLLALARAALLEPAPDPARSIRVTRELLGRLAVVAGGDSGGAGERAALDAWIDEEVLYREGVARGLAWNPATIARLVQVGRFVGAAPADAEEEALAGVARLGLDHDDALVRAQVAGRMRLLLHEAAMRDEPDEAELERWFAARREQLVRPARASFVHVFVARRRGRAAAEALRRRITEERLEVADALRLGDPFGPGHRFASWSRRDVEATFGAEVAQAVLTQPERRWSDPTPSAYGWHLLRVDGRRGDEPLPLAAVRDRVRQAWRAAHAREEVAARVRA
ncbi:MAG: peptidylprolyl isomerase, partial [Thermodesulfobacteriota bacterium]